MFTVEVHEIVTAMKNGHPLSSDTFNVEHTGPYVLNDAIRIAVEYITQLAHKTYDIVPMMGRDLGWHCEGDGGLLTVEFVEVQE